MPVVGFSITSVEANKEEATGGQQITANSAPNIVDVKETTILSLDKKVLEIKFEFLTEYKPDIGKIKLGGALLYVTDNHEEVLESWEKDKKLPDTNSVEVLNNLFRKCLLKILNLADDLQLPPPVQFPIVKLKDEKPPSKATAG